MDRLDLNPFERMTPATDPQRWTEHTPATNVTREFWTITRPIRLLLPGWPLAPIGDSWVRAIPSESAIDVVCGFWFDGSSGPMLNDAKALWTGFVHDVACHPIMVCGAVQYPVRGYLRRCLLYGVVMRAQGGTLWRASYATAGLVLGNWIVMLNDREECQ